MSSEVQAKWRYSLWAGGVRVGQKLLFQEVFHSLHVMLRGRFDRLHTLSVSEREKVEMSTGRSTHDPRETGRAAAVQRQKKERQSCEMG